MHELRIAVLNQVLEAIGRSDGIAGKTGKI